MLRFKNNILVIAKPDLVIRRGAGARMLKSFLESTTGKILCSNMLLVPTTLAEVHYAHVSERRFYQWLLNYISCYQSFAFVLETDRSIDLIRKQLGSTIVQSAAPDSLRHIYGLYNGMNGLHVSESEEEARKEIENWMRFGVLQRGRISFDVLSYIEKYLDAPDNTAGIHRILAAREELDLLFSASTKHTHRLFHLIQEEAINVDDGSVRSFYDLLLEGIELH